MAYNQPLRMDGNSRFQYVIGVTGLNLATLSAKMMVKSQRGGALLMTLTPYLTIDAIAGQIIIDVPASVNKAQTWRQGVYDIAVYKPSDSTFQPVRIIQGDIYLDGEVTD